MSPLPRRALSYEQCGANSAPDRGGAQGGPTESVRHSPAVLSLFEDEPCLSSFEDGGHAMPEEFTLTGWSKLGESL